MRGSRDCPLTFQSNILERYRVIMSEQKEEIRTFEGGSIL